MSSIEYINSTVLSANATNILFSNIPSTYQDLKIILNSTVNADSYNPTIRFNSDANSNYSVTRLTGRPSVIEANYGSNLTYIIASSYTITNVFSVVEIDIFDYAKTNFYKTALIQYGGTGTISASIVGLWRSTNAINTINLIANSLNSGNFTSGTTATLWGIK